MTRPDAKHALIALASVLLLTATACSSAKGSSKPASRTSTARRAAGPAAVLSGPVNPASGVSLLLPTPVDDAGYRQTEYFASGTADSYRPNGRLPNDGRWSVAPDQRASYETRIVVRTPVDPAKFNGTVVVEWLNVTGGFDTAADLVYMSPELERSGYAWVGVTAQRVGIEGGAAIAGVKGAPQGGLRGTDPARYGALHHPGDAFSFDMFSQIGRAIRGTSAVKPLGTLRPRRLIAVGESQSAFALTTYIDAVEPRAHVFDGFFVHSRFGGVFPLSGASIANVATGAVRIRTDLEVPVLLVETETDESFGGYYAARQPDTDRIRLWDVAGASHADTWFVPPAGVSILGCTGEINAAPTHDVIGAGLHALDRWVRTGTPPPSAPRMDVRLVDGKPVIRRDALGIAIGGIRTAAVDAPSVVYSGEPASTSNVSCSLFGSTKPLTAATLARLYPSHDAYVAAVTKATDRAIARGWLLRADRAEIIAAAERTQV